VKEASGQRMGDAARARFRSPVDVAEGVETQNATVERNVRVPADVEERAPTTARATASTSPLWLGEFAEPNTTRLSGEARRQQRLSLARGAPWDRI
jgi:hypothetical protein